MANEPINEDKIITKDDVEITVEFPNLQSSEEDFVNIDLDDLKNLTLPEPGTPPAISPNNNVEVTDAPNLVSPPEARRIIQQDPFSNPNPPVIASNNQFQQNVQPTSLANTAIQNNRPLTSDQPGVTIGNTSDFLRAQTGAQNVQNADTGAGVDNRTIFNTLDPETGLPIGTPGTDDSTVAGAGTASTEDFGRLRGFNAGDGDGDSTGTSVGTGARRVFNQSQKTTNTTAPEVSADWRFRIGLLPGSQDLYKGGFFGDIDVGSGILDPLIDTDGVIFPYTPSIQMTYYADYQSTAPTHSNFPSRFYASSEVRDVQVNGTFTAQSTAEADYMMAAIHFFRSCTKMFYGQDSNRGQPPPLLQVTGLGPHQFNGHKCVLQQFNYTLPEDVDYVRTSAGGVTTKSVNQIRGRQQSGADQFGIFGIAGRIGRLLGIGANRGAMPNTLTQRSATSRLAKAGASYVPTKMEFSLTLLPVVSRQEQTANYSTLGYANGQNYKNRGHW